MSDPSAETSRFLTREQLLAYAAEHGCSVSSEQLDRWRKRGLVPAPVLKGRGRGLGVEARYPLIAGPQLVHVAEALKTTRDADAVLWRLWWHGADIRPEYVRKHIARALHDAKARRSEVERIQEDDDASTQFEERARSRLPNRSVHARIRRRIGKNRYPTFQMLLKELTAGIDQSHVSAESEEAEIVRTGLFLPWTREVMADAMRQIANASDPTALEHSLAATPDVGFTRARDELRAMLAQMERVGRGHPTDLIGQIPGGAWAGVMAMLSEELPPDLFLVWLHMRQMPAFKLVYDVIGTVLRMPRNEWPSDVADLMSGRSNAET